MLNDFGIEGVYVVHALKGYEHHELRVKELFMKHHIPFEFVTDGDPSHFKPQLLNTYFTKDINLSTGVLSCTLNHIFAYEKIVKNKNRYALVFENDPFFLGDFFDQITRIAREVNERGLKGFIISLENTCLRYPSFHDTRKGEYLYQASAGRAAGAYMIDYQAAEDILNDLKENKCHTVIDWWHNSMIDRGVVKMFWAHPPLVEQGSHNGLLNSTISSKQKSILRQGQWKAQKIYKMYLHRLFREKRIISD